MKRWLFNSTLIYLSFVNLICNDCDGRAVACTADTKNRFAFHKHQINNIHSTVCKEFFTFMVGSSLCSNVFY